MSRSSLPGTDHTPAEPAGREADTPAESVDAGSDAGGIGGRRSATSEDPDLSFMDEDEAGDPLGDEDEDDERDEDIAADRGRDRAALLRIDAAIPLPGQQSDPDPPDPLPEDRSV